MIKYISIKDEDIFYKLGSLISNNFSKLYNYNNIIEDNNSILVGYYEDNLLVGFIHCMKSIDSIDIVNIVVDNNYRRRGIATKLIEYIISNNKNKDYFLEVRESNIEAINLYKKNKFYVVNVRKNYYQDEDALLMKRDDI